MEDEILKACLQESRLADQGFDIRWLRSTDYNNGYDQLKAIRTINKECEYFEPNLIPPKYLINESDSLEFKRKFKGLFPDMSNKLKMLVITKSNRVVASGVLYNQNKEAGSEDVGAICTIGDLRANHDILQSENCQVTE